MIFADQSRRNTDRCRFSSVLIYLRRRPPTNYLWHRSPLRSQDAGNDPTLHHDDHTASGPACRTEMSSVTQWSDEASWTRHLSRTLNHIHHTSLISRTHSKRCGNCRQLPKLSAQTPNSACRLPMYIFSAVWLQWVKKCQRYIHNYIYPGVPPGNCNSSTHTANQGRL